MFENIDIGLRRQGATTSGIVRKGGLVTTVQIPVTLEDGKLVNGGIAAQSRMVFEKLALAMEAAGGSMADVMLVQVYLINSSDWKTMNEIWGDVFSDPFPARATVVVKELMLEGMLIEIVANAHLG